MKTYLDTSAIIAVLNSSDQYHLQAKSVWENSLINPVALISNNYVLVEIMALLQHRFGMEAVRLFQNEVLPIIEIIWVDEATHQRAISALLAANRRDLSLVDCTSFETIRQLSIEQVFTFDPHFSEQGFIVIPHSY
jgi:uncharacterized protein